MRCYYSTVANFYVQNFGCRATQADGAAIERQFQERGLDRATSAAEAEVVILNTCTVTSSADQDARSAIRRVHRENPGAQIIVTGCYAQRAPQELAALPGVAQVIGNSHKHQLAEIAVRENTRSAVSKSEIAQTFVPLTSLTTAKDTGYGSNEHPIFVSDIFAHTELIAAPVFDASNERTRPNLKVQDGCDNRCSFCVIPFVRGQSRSLTLDRVLQEVNSLVAAGYRELVISGINLGRWGRDLDESVTEQVSAVGRAAHWNAQPAGNGLSSRKATVGQNRLRDLIRAILDHTELEKLRISSVEPMDWSDDLIHLVAASPRIAKHAHVPMQSGSDAVLRRMHRKYRPWHYCEKIEKIRSAMPMAAIGADVMVGFPGETDDEFEQTLRVIEDLPFTYLHVFTFSARPSTPAADMGSQVPQQVARQRSRILRDLGEQKKMAFMQSFVGKSIEAITLTREADTVLGKTCETEALTDNYLKMRLRGNYPGNLWVHARVEGIQDGSLVARLAD